MIVSAIQNVVSQMSIECSFIYGFKGWQNLKADKTAVFPVIFLDEPISSVDNFSQGGAVDITYNLNIAFLTKSQLSWTAEEHDTVIQAMRNVRREFILRLKKIADTSTNQHLFRSISNITTLNAMNVFDVNLSGVLVSFQIVPMSEDGICLAVSAS
jgi:ABC-type microcin C transport system duplicated ATPase subunit YejF